MHPAAAFLRYLPVELHRLNHNSILKLEIRVGWQDEAAVVEVLSERESSSDGESSDCDDIESDDESGSEDDGSVSGDEADPSRAGPSRAGPSKALARAGGSGGDVGGDGSGDEDDGEESDGYGDEGLSWEAVLASVGAAPSAEADAAEAAQLALQVGPRPTQSSFSCCCLLAGSLRAAAAPGRFLAADQNSKFRHAPKNDKACCSVAPSAQSTAAGAAQHSTAGRHSQEGYL